MEIIEILRILAQGEDSKNQFKKDFADADALATELILFRGGNLFKCIIWRHQINEGR